MKFQLTSIINLSYGHDPRKGNLRDFVHRYSYLNNKYRQNLIANQNKLKI